MQIDELFVRELIADRFPDWAQMRIRTVPSAGTVHSIYRLGSQMLVRIPNTEDGAVSLAKERDCPTNGVNAVA
jgi:aminoglycoside phosphotransferase (APT) family kinase protein